VERYLKHIAYARNRQYEQLTLTHKNFEKDVVNIVNSKVAEKGNELIYQMDNLSRQMRFWRECIQILESQMRTEVRKDFLSQLEMMKLALNNSQTLFKDFKQAFTTELKADISQEKTKLVKKMNVKSFEYKQASPSKKEKPTWFGNKQKEQIPKRMQKNDSEDLDTERIERAKILQEQWEETEVYEELMNLEDKYRKMRIFTNLKQMTMKERYERDIFNLTEELTSNAALWDELAETEKREQLIKEELLHAQQCLGSCERIINNLQQKINMQHDNTVKLQQFKV
jgi:hypothetical protein